MVDILRVSRDIWKPFSALAAADLIALATTPAVGDGVKSSMVKASSTFFPRTMSAIRRTLLADILTFLATARTSIFSIS
jgi:hypothetical protein